MPELRKSSNQQWLAPAVLSLIALANTAAAQIPNVPNVSLSQANQAIRSRSSAFVAGAAAAATKYALRQSPAVRNQILLETQRTIDLARRGSAADRLAAARRRQIDYLNVQPLSIPAATAPNNRPATPVAAAIPNQPLPTGFTNDDLATYDHVFGRYNPLRLTGETGENWRQNVQYAARHRRAELSQLRDSALANNDLETLVRARRLEIALDAIVESATTGPTVPN